MKKVSFAVALMAVLLGISVPLTIPAYADIPNVVISGQVTENAEDEDRALLEAWYSVNGFPSWDDVVAIGDGDRVKAPSADSFLNEYRVGYINAPKGNHVYVYRNPGSTKDPEMIEHGAKVYVIAENGKTLLVIYRTLDNKPRSGWINSNVFSDSFPGYTVTVGTESVENAVNIGDPSTTWSKDNMSETKTKYLILDDPVEDCVGFTLEYRAQYGGYEDCSGTRNVYINDGTGWRYIGKFPYETAKSYHITVYLNQPTTLYAVAAPLEIERDKAFTVRTNLLDVLVDKAITGHPVVDEVQKLIHEATLGDELCYAVDIHECKAALGFNLLGIVSTDDVLENGRSELAYFQFERPIVNCLYISIPITIFARNILDFYGVKWGSYLHFPDDGHWYWGQEYDYTDQIAAEAIFALDSPQTIDGFTVAPISAPQGYGAYDIRFEESGIIIAFSDRASAASFIEEAWKIE